MFLGIALPGPEDTSGSSSLGDFVRGSSFAPVCVYIIIILFMLQEERLRYYLDYGLTSNPQFSPPTPTPAFSVSSRIKSTSSDSESSNLGLGCPIPPTVVEESATGTCSSCAAKLDAGVESDEEVEAASEESGSGSESDRDTRNVSLCLLTTAFLFSASSRSYFKHFSSQ